jgi:hypothetical protein
MRHHTNELCVKLAETLLISTVSHIQEIIIPVTNMVYFQAFSHWPITVTGGIELPFYINLCGSL